VDAPQRMTSFARLGVIESYLKMSALWF